MKLMVSSVCVAWSGPALACGGWFTAVVEVLLVDVLVLVVDEDEVDVVVGRLVEVLLELLVDDVLVEELLELDDVDVELLELELDDVEVELVEDELVLVVAGTVVVVGTSVVDVLVVGGAVELLDDEVEVLVELDVDVVLVLEVVGTVVVVVVGATPFAGVVTRATVE